MKYSALLSAGLQCIFVWNKTQNILIPKRIGGGELEMKLLLGLKVNGQPYEVAVEPWMTLAQLLRDELGLTGVKVSCNSGSCGSCTVLMDGMAVRSCLVLAPQAKGKEILTIEGLATAEGLHPLQETFIEHFAVQCGFCTGGMILTAKSILDENPEATEEDIKSAMSGNLCRCTGYVKIIEAIIAGKEKMRNFIMQAEKPE